MSGYWDRLYVLQLNGGPAGFELIVNGVTELAVPIGPVLFPGSRNIYFADGTFWAGGEFFISHFRALGQVPCCSTAAPRADAGVDQTMPESMLVTLDASESRGICGPLTYQWTQIAGNAATLNLTDPSAPTFTAPLVPVGGATLTFQLVVSDGTNSSAPDIVNITVTNVNHTPVAVADGPAAVAEGGVAALDGSHSYDDDDEPLTYSWQQVSGTSVVLSDASSASPSFTAPFVGFGGESLTFELTVSDSIDSASDTVSVLVENVNHVPTANAGNDQTKAEGSTVTLDASASGDPDGDTLVFCWSQISGPAVALVGGNNASPSFTAPQVGPAGETLVFRITVDDGYGGTDDDAVTITVQDTNSPPDCGLARPSVAELWPPNHKMVAVSILGVTDPDNNTITISILNVTQDEPIDGLGDGDTAPDAVLQGQTVLLRAERAGSGAGNGRVYLVTFEASDGNGGTCTGIVSVCVPHSKGRNAPPCVDDGQSYSSLGP